MTEYFELLKKRRSIRDFEDKEVPLDTIREMIKESCFAPSSGNGQPWRFIIVNNKELIGRLSGNSKENLISQLEKNPDSPIKKYENVLRDPKFNIFYNAPCLVFIVCSKKISTRQVDCALAASYFMFSAVERGLGTCWIGLGINVGDPVLLKDIGMPEDFKIVAPIIIGYPKNIPGLPERMEPQILKTNT